jgi:hypothetical protein
MRPLVVLAVLAACHGAPSRGTLVALRTACPDPDYWDGSACRPRGDAAAKVAAGKQALARLDVDVATAALDGAERGGPLDHDTNVTLWEQRGIAAAYVDDERTATAAFDMLLALDPSHFLSYTLSPKATFVFEKVRNETQRHGVPALDVNWPHGQRVGDPVPIDLEVVSDPKRFLRRATVFVRTRGEPSWRAADIPLSASPDHRVLLPPIDASRPVSLELYLRAYDDHGNEVLTWADPARPREIPLRYDPPPAWYERKDVLIPAGIVVLAAVAFGVYEFTLAPPEKIGGPVTVK